MPRTFRCVWLDVFAERPLEGNPLAVFPEAEGLSDDEMQAIARETHLSETTFVFPTDEARDRADGFRTRIFAVAGEMPFAGHPTLGTAYVLARSRGLSEIALALRVGKIPVRFTSEGARPFGEMEQNDPHFGRTHDRSTVARALGIAEEDLDPTLPIETVSTGNPFAIVPFRSLRVLRNLRPDAARLHDYLATTDAKYGYLVCRETDDPAASLHARMIFSGGEDPATGSAAGPAVAWMVLHGVVPPATRIVIEQGDEVRRPSRIYGSSELRDGAPVHVRIGGHCAEVVTGELRV